MTAHPVTRRVAARTDIGVTVLLPLERLTQPDDGITEPALLRRADGSMRALAAAWTEDGGHVIGLAPSAAAAAALREQIVATTDTLAKLTWSPHRRRVRRLGGRPDPRGGRNHAGPTHDLVSQLNQRAQAHRLGTAPEHRRTAHLADGCHAGVLKRAVRS